MSDIHLKQIQYFSVKIMDLFPARMSVSASVSTRMSVSAFFSGLLSMLITKSLSMTTTASYTGLVRV